MPFSRRLSLGKAPVAFVDRREGEAGSGTRLLAAGIRSAACFAPVVLAAILFGGTAGNVRAQGCVAVRPMGCAASEHLGAGGLLARDEWQVNASYQYFRSFRHFRGDHEEANRVEENTEVVNINHSSDLAISYGIRDRLRLTANVPFIYYDRSSLYEHYGNSESANPGRNRFHTGASGIGDIRVSANYWLVDPMTMPRGNFALGFGIKMPTGDEGVTDTFHKRAADGSDSLVTKPVDQSIQPGDGGWGFTLQGEGYRGLFHRTGVYFSGFYLFNPRETNDTPHNATTNHSVADQFFARAGLDWSVLPAHGLGLNLGARLEGIPAEDLIGGDEGRRRPGYTVSIEPGLSYQASAVSLSLNVPVALYRNRTQSVDDKRTTQETGVHTQGDAAFADYVINLSISRQFGGGHEDRLHEDAGGEE